MALLFMDSFDHYTNSTSSADANLLQNCAPGVWHSSETLNNLTHCKLPTMPGYGTRGLQMYWSRSQNFDGMRYKLPFTIASGMTIGVGFHYYISATPAGDGTQYGKFFGFSQGNGTNPGFIIKMKQSGAINCRVGGTSSTDLGTDSTFLFGASTLYHVEIKTYFHASAGTVEVRVNGATIFTASGLATLGTAQEYIGLAFGNNAGYTDSSLQYFDNFYVWDGTGSTNNDFLGEREVLTLFPAGDTAQEDWVCSTGSDSYNLINDVPYTSDYLEAEAVDDQTTVTLDDLTTSGFSVLAVQPTVKATKAEAGESALSIGVVSSGTEGLSGNLEPAFNQIGMFYHILEQNPNTLTDWDTSSVDAAQFTIKKTV